MAVDLTTYQGNAALGVGSNPDIPVVASDKALDVLNNTIRDIMLFDNQKNVLQFQDKVKQRDQLNQLILDNQVSTGDILPEYQPHFDAAKERVENAFKEWKGNSNDTAGFRKYQSAVQDLRDVAAHGQVNTVQLKKMQQEIANERLPRKKADMQRFYDSQVKASAKNFWNPVTPYQQLHDFSIDDILKFAVPKSKSYTDLNNPFGSYDETYFDFNDILKNARNGYVNDMEVADSIDQFYDKLQQYKPQELNLALDAIDTQINKYNQERGTNVPQIKREVDSQGRPIITDSKIDFAAKYALAQQPSFSTKTPKFNKDIAKYGIDKAKLALEGKKLGIDAAKAQAYIQHEKAATRKLLTTFQNQGTNVDEWYQDIINQIKPGGVETRTFLKNTKTGKLSDIKTTGKLDAIFLDQLAPSHRYITGPVLNSKTGKIEVRPLEGFKTPDGREYWVPKYVDAGTGEEINTKKLPSHLQQGYNLTRQKKNISIEDYIKGLIMEKRIDAIFQGKNGSGNLNSIFQSAKTLNAIGTTKGEENIVNAPPESSQSQSTETETQPEPYQERP